jgi:hypothetical protein
MSINIVSACSFDENTSTWQSIGDIVRLRARTLKWQKAAPRGNLYIHALECLDFPTMLIPAIRADLANVDRHLMLGYNGFVAFKTEAEMTRFLLRWTGTFDMEGNPQ